MAEVKKTQHSDNKSAKSSKEEMFKGNFSKPVSKNSDIKDESKDNRRASSRHLK